MYWFFLKKLRPKSVKGPIPERFTPLIIQPANKVETASSPQAEKQESTVQISSPDTDNKIVNFLRLLQRAQTTESTKSDLEGSSQNSLSIFPKEVLGASEQFFSALGANKTIIDFLLSVYAPRMKDAEFQTSHMTSSKSVVAQARDIASIESAGSPPDVQFGETFQNAKSHFTGQAAVNSILLNHEVESLPAPKEPKTATSTREELKIIERLGAHTSIDPLDEQGYSFEDALGSEKPQEKDAASIREKVERVEKTEVKEYELRGRFAKARITTEPDGQIVYSVIEVVLSVQEADLLNEIEEFLQEELEIDVRSLGSSEKVEQHLRDQVKNIVKRYRLKLSDEAYENITYYIIRDFIYYGKIDPLMRDQRIEDISCNGPGLPIYVWHKDCESIPTNITFATSEELDKFIVKLTYITRRAISIAQPMVDASLPDGSRLQVTYEKEITRRGSSFTIRKFREKPLTVTELLLSGTVTSAVAAWFWFVIEKQASIIVVGGTASGKTTTVNMLSTFIRPTAKIISIEDTAELQLHHENWLSSVVRTGVGVGSKSSEITLYDLLRNAMRQRPDYIIVGEVRGSEAYTLVQAIATGHGGLATLHADSVEAAIHRLESEPMNIPRSLVTTIDVVVVQGRVRISGQSVRRILSVTEMVGLDSATKDLLTNEVFKWNSKTDAHDYPGRSYLVERIMKTHGLSYEQVKSDLEKRRIVLEWLVSKRKTDFRELVEIIRSYYLDSSSLFKRIESEKAEEDKRTDVKTKEQVLVS